MAIWYFIYIYIYFSFKINLFYLITLYKTPAIIWWHSIRVAVTHERNETERNLKKIQSLTHTPGGKPVETTTTSWFCSLLLFTFFFSNFRLAVRIKNFSLDINLIFPPPKSVNPISYSCCCWNIAKFNSEEMDLSVATHTHTHTHDTEISQEIAGTHKKKCFFYFFSCFIFLIFCTPTTMEKRNEQDGLCSLLRYNDNDNCLHFIACLNEKKKRKEE